MSISIEQEGYCENIVPTSNAQLTGNPLGKVGESARLVCDNGYELNGDEPFDAVCTATNVDYGNWTTDKSCKSMEIHEVMLYSTVKNSSLKHFDICNDKN